MGRMRNLWVLLALVLFSVSIHDFHVSADVIPSENECRPYIEKAIHELKNVETTGTDDDKESIEENIERANSIENEAVPEDGTESVEDNADKSTEEEGNDDNKSDDGTASQENQTEENASVDDATKEDDSSPDDDSKEQNDSTDEAATDDNATNESVDEKTDEDGDSKEQDGDADSKEGDSKEQQDTDGDSKEANDADSKEANDADSKETDSQADGDSKEGDSKEQVESDAQDDDNNDSKESAADDGADSKENDNEDDANDSAQTEEKEEQDDNESEQANDGSTEESTEKDGEKADTDSLEDGENQTAENETDSKEDETEPAAEGDADSKEASTENDSKDTDSEQANDEESAEEKVRAKRSLPDEADKNESDEQQESTQNDDNESNENANESQENTAESQDEEKESQENAEDSKEGGEEKSDEEVEEVEVEVEQPEEDLTMEFEIPKNLRPRGHVSDLLGLDAESSIKENALKRTGDVILKELKKVFDNAIHPLEATYKYRDLSNRHFGDPEIFSKPLVLFMGPWSGGKSTILNYLTENEYTANSIRSGAEPSPAYFNILMHGDEPEVLDGTQLAADWTFSGLQKFGQGLMDRLRGQKLPSKLLERVNIVEIPGILEVRKQVSRYFPFNDACQWFIDRADIIFLVYDPSKLDVGPETEAILDQLKGREYQTRILLNKADQVKPEELLRVQGALIWNISPLMSSAQPPVMYTVSLWSHPFEHGAPIRLLQAQERAFLIDLREAIDRRIENKIASARRFAVRIRNHAKMVDCYLTTYYNQKGLFSNKKYTADKIIEHPQNYNIYEGLSTLTNISRYDLPDPEVYLDFFRLNPLYEFKKLSDTCTYFKGCPINKLDIAIAYDLPELVGKYKKQLETNLIQLRKEYDDNCNQTEPELPVKIINST